MRTLLFQSDVTNSVIIEASVKLKGFDIIKDNSWRLRSCLVLMQRRRRMIENAAF